MSLIIFFITLFSLNAFGEVTVSDGAFISPRSDRLIIQFRTFETESPAAVDTRSPLVISPGRGESSIRYKHWAKLMAQLFNPIYVIDHRSQGGSESVREFRLRRTTVRRFEDYVRDFIYFNDEVVKSDLDRRGIKEKPQILSHSMGALVAGLALSERPDLADKIAFISPMFGIRLRERGIQRTSTVKFLTSLICRLGCGHLFTINPNANFEKKAPDLLKVAVAVEQDLGERVDPIDIQWLRESMMAAARFQSAVEQIRAEALMVLASKDGVVSNSASEAIACKIGERCKKISLDGRHPIHFEGGEVEDQIVEALTNFFNPTKCDLGLAGQSAVVLNGL